MIHPLHDHRMVQGRRRSQSGLRTRKSSLEDPQRRNLLFAAGLIAFGLAAILYQGIAFMPRAPVARLEPFQMKAAGTQGLQWPSILGASTILGGMGLLMLGRHRPS